MTYIGHGFNSSSVELVDILVVQPKFVELEVELVLSAERVLLIPSLNRDVAIGSHTVTVCSIDVRKIRFGSVGQLVGVFFLGKSV